ncbi:MAG: NAD(P)-binding protein [Pseudomonadales bacterium]|nr:NAD(P)-binding protein [Pseudomonadales bacterium]
MDSSRPIEVAVVGGGCASIATAYELSKPEHNGRYHVTVYQMGWRLGGKAASGRGPAQRIEEHGLHIWLGFYENAFAMVRECYEALNRDSNKHPYSDWTDVFFPDSHVGVAERDNIPTDENESWSAWTALFPPGEGSPGDPLTSNDPLTLSYAIFRGVDLLQTLIVGLDRARHQPTPPNQEMSAASAAAAGMLRMVSLGVLSSTAAVSEALGILGVVMRSLPSYQSNVVLKFVETISSSARTLLEKTVASDPQLARRWEIMDLALAILVGVVREGILVNPKGLDALNDYECRAWLKENGASDRALECGFIRGLYDLALAYEDGDPNKPSLAAGQAVRGSIRMFFTYRGALFWKMRGSMGDLVFAPLYELLQKRGVSFKYFHKLTNVGMAQSEDLLPGEKPFVQTLEFDVQAKTQDGKPYQPLIDVGGVEAWPAAPLFEQLEDGQKLRDSDWDPEAVWDSHAVESISLDVSKDFDFLVLGLSVGAVPSVCSEIIERDPRWRMMVDKVKTVATQACQIWMKEDMVDLGWFEPPITLSAFKKPFDTWADMSYLADVEAWPESPRSIAYFCGVLADPKEDYVLDRNYQRQREAEVRKNARRHLNKDIKALWPAAATQKFCWSMLQCPDPEDDARMKGKKRFNTQYWRANLNPTDRYVLALPGSLAYRISPLDNTYDNMTVAGDWTDCGFNEGCVEAAVMSGRLAAHAISHSPPLEDIVGYDYL